MSDIKKRIAIIESLLVEGSIQSLTYAALECRLTIEAICYERLWIAHNYIAAADLKRWQPKHVVKQVSQEANDLIDQGLELSISTTPVQKGKEPETQEDYEAYEYVRLGQQVGFKISKMDSLWNALSKEALHVNVSKGKGELSPYGDADAIRKKVNEALDELKKFQHNNLIVSGFGMDYKFPCEECKFVIKRKAKLLQDKQVVNCINPDCDESYTIYVDGTEIMHLRRNTVVNCKSCGKEFPFATRKVEKLRFGGTLEVSCPFCNDITNLSLFISGGVRENE